MTECPVPSLVIREGAPCVGLREPIGILYNRETAGGEWKIPDVGWVRNRCWRIVQDGMPFRVPFEGDLCVLAGVRACTSSCVVHKSAFIYFRILETTALNYSPLNAHVMAWQVAHIDTTRKGSGITARPPWSDGRDKNKVGKRTVRYLPASVVMLNCLWCRLLPHDGCASEVTVA